MITLETLEHLPNAKKTVGKFIVGIEKQDGTNKRRLFYIGANVDRNQSKTQLLQEAGFEKEDRKGYCRNTGKRDGGQKPSLSYWDVSGAVKDTGILRSEIIRQTKMLDFM